MIATIPTLPALLITSVFLLASYSITILSFPARLRSLLTSSSVSFCSRATCIMYYPRGPLLFFVNFKLYLLERWFLSWSLFIHSSRLRK